MKKNKKTLLFLSVLGTTVSTATVFTPIVREFASKTINSQENSLLPKAGVADYISLKNKFSTNSSASGYFEINGNKIELFNYMGKLLWEFDANSTKLQKFVDSNNNLAGYYANSEFTDPKYTLVQDPKNPNRTAVNGNVQILDAGFNDKDPTKLVLLTGKVSGSNMLLNLVEIDTLTGKPRINNASSPDPVFNKAFSGNDASQYGGVLDTFSNSSAPFLVISNGNAMVMSNTAASSGYSNYVVDLASNISVQYDFSSLSGATPIGYTALNNSTKDVVLTIKTANGKLGWVTLNADLKTFKNNTIQETTQDYSDSTFVPFFYGTKNGTEIIAFNRANNTLYKFNLANAQTAAQTLSVGAGDITLNGQNSTGTIVVSNNTEVKVIDANAWTDKTSIIGATSIDGKNKRVVVINSTFTQDPYIGGSGALLKDTNPENNRWVKISSDFSTIKVEQQDSVTVKDSNELLKNDPARFKLNTVVKFGDLTSILGFTAKDGVQSSDTLSLIGENKEVIKKDLSDVTPIAGFYPSAVAGDKLSFDYQIGHSSWWNTDDKINYVEHVDLTGFSTERDYTVELKKDAPWSNPAKKNFMPSKVRIENILKNIQFGVPGKTQYPATLENIDTTIETDPAAKPNDFTTTSAPYIKVYANDEKGTLSIAYDFTSCPGFSPENDKIPYQGVKSVITISDFKTKRDFQTFYPVDQKITNLLNSTLSINVSNRDIYLTLPQLSPGYASPEKNPELWKWENFGSIFKNDEVWKKNTWNNYLNGVLTYSGNIGIDIDGLSENPKRRIFFIPEDAPQADQNGNYTFSYNGQNYEGKLWTENDQTGDKFIDTREVKNVTNSVFTKITGMPVPANGFDPTSQNIETTIKSELGTNVENNGSHVDIPNDKSAAFIVYQDSLKDMFKKNITEEDVEKIQLDNSTSKKSSIYKKILRNLFDGALAPIYINDEWFDFEQVNLTFSNKKEPAKGEYYFTYDLKISIPSSAETNIKYGNRNLTFEDLGLSTATGTIFDLDIPQIEVIDFARIYETLTLQEKLVKQGIKLVKNEDTFSSTIELSDISNKFAEEYSSYSASSMFKKLNANNEFNYSDLVQKEEFANKVNNEFTFLDTSVKYNSESSSSSTPNPPSPDPDTTPPDGQTDPNTPPTNPTTYAANSATPNPSDIIAYKVESVQASTNDNDGVLTLVFKIHFNDPTTGQPFSGSVGTKFISLNIDGFYSYKYELVMWAIFSTTLAIAIIAIVLLCMWLRKERNKKRLWNIKK